MNPRGKRNRKKKLRPHKPSYSIRLSKSAPSRRNTPKATAFGGGSLLWISPGIQGELLYPSRERIALFLEQEHAILTREYFK